MKGEIVVAANNQNNQEQDLNQLLKVRREKLADLQAQGKDPFVITKYDVTHHSTDIKDGFEELEGKTVTIAGRMMSKRKELLYKSRENLLLRMRRKMHILFDRFDRFDGKNESIIEKMTALCLISSFLSLSGCIACVRRSVSVYSVKAKI